MPNLEMEQSPQPGSAPQTEVVDLVFPPVTRDQILNCAYDAWYPNYQKWTAKSLIFPLPSVVVDYLREDGILLSDEDAQAPLDPVWRTTPSQRMPRPAFMAQYDSDSDSEDEAPPRPPPNARFPEFHQSLKDAIAELGGAVIPKLNWSAPKDATRMNPHQNTLKCTTPDNIYLLLKSSLFVSHDLEYAFDDTITLPSTAATTAPRPFQPVLVLRPFIESFNPALEFRCFVKHRVLIGICQRDNTPTAGIDSLRDQILSRVDALFYNKLANEFPDQNFVFDVYIPEKPDGGFDDAQLVDINPWAPRTDTLLFDWKELLEMNVPIAGLGGNSSEEEIKVIRALISGHEEELNKEETPGEGVGGVAGGEDESEDDEPVFEPELRLMKADDPTSFDYTSRYAAHKVPREVVDATMAGGQSGGLAELAAMFREIREGR